MRRLYRSALFLIGFSLFILSCQKELLDLPTQAEQVDLTPITIEQAMRHYAQSPLSSHSAARREGDKVNRKDLKKDPLWKRAVNKKLGENDVIIVPMRHEEYMALRVKGAGEPEADGLSKNDSQIGLDETLFLYFYKNKKGKS